MTHYSFVYDETQVNAFHNLLSPLENSEAYFLSMSARTKYLTEHEREYYQLGRTEMFARKLVKRSDFDAYMRVVRTLEVAYGGYTSKTDVPLPDKAMVVYANINPVSGEKALQEFYTKTNEMLFDLGRNEQTRERFAKLDTLLMNCYQRARSRKTLLDVDFDTKKDAVVHEFVNELQSQGVTYFVVETKSGYHVLMKKSTVNFNYPAVVSELNKKVKAKNPKAEVVVNKNDMVPLPGTLQAGFRVRLLP